MRWPLTLLAACALGAQAAGLPQSWVRQAQDVQLLQREDAGLKTLHRYDSVATTQAPAQVGPGAHPTNPVPVPRPIRRAPTAVTPPAERANPDLRPDPHGLWHERLTAAERGGLGPELLAHIEAWADWLEQAADADLLQRLGWVLLASGRTHEAEHWFARALARDPHNAAARKGLAQSLTQRGALAEGYALLEPLAEAAPERRALADALAEQARATGDDASERHWLERALAQTNAEDLGLRERLAWNAQRRRDWAAATAAWRRLLAVEDRPQWREAMAAALQAQGELAAAHQALAGLPDAAAWRAALALDLAAHARAQADLAAEDEWLQSALKDAPTERDVYVRLAGNAEARGQWDAAAGHWARAYALAPDAATAEAWAGSLLRAGRTAELEQLAATDAGPFKRWWQTWQARRLLDRGLARAAARIAPPGAVPELAGTLAPRLGLGLAARSKSGMSGGGRLRLKRAPQLRYAGTHADGWLETELSGVAADAGLTSAALPFGAAVPGQAPVATRVGTATALRLRWSSLTAAGPELEIGTTALDAPVPATATFTLAWRETEDDCAWRAALYREPVRDSVLSLMGQHDPASGAAWGRVLRDGMSLGGYRRLGEGPWSLAGELKIEQLSGHSVADNRRLAAQIELMHGFEAPGFRYLQAGPSLGWEGYRRDLSAYTWGHGGYFSPRDFTQAGAALQFETADRPDWRLAGRLSAQWQRVERASASCHPLPPPAVPSTCLGGYAGEQNEGLATQVELRAVTRLTPRWQLAGSVGYRHGPAYRDQAAGLMLVYLFEPQLRLSAEDLSVRLDHMGR